MAVSRRTSIRSWPPEPTGETRCATSSFGVSYSGRAVVAPKRIRTLFWPATRLRCIVRRRPKVSTTTATAEATRLLRTVPFSFFLLVEVLADAHLINFRDLSKSDPRK